jgi:hypothetical protein
MCAVRQACLGFVTEVCTEKQRRKAAGAGRSAGIRSWNKFTRRSFPRLRGRWSGSFATPEEANMANKLLTLCTATVLATTLSLATATSGSAADWGSGNWRAAAIGAGIAGVAVGAAAASSPYYNSGYYGSGYYAYAPGYAPGGAIGSSGPIYDAVGAGWYSQGRDDCRFNINNC